jgi:hypothetical protein
MNLASEYHPTEITSPNPISGVEMARRHLRAAVVAANKLSELLTSASQEGISSSHSAHLAELGRKAELFSNCLRNISRGGR